MISLGIDIGGTNVKIGLLDESRPSPSPPSASPSFPLTAAVSR